MSRDVSPGPGCHAGYYQSGGGENLGREVHRLRGLVGRDPKMIQIFKQIKVLAENDYTVLITGETGAGKELVARGHPQRKPAERGDLSCRSTAAPA